MSAKDLNIKREKDRNYHHKKKSVETAVDIKARRERWRKNQRRSRAKQLNETKSAKEKRPITNLIIERKGSSK